MPPVVTVLAALEVFITKAQQEAPRLFRNRLGVMLVLTRKALEAYPLDEDDYITDGGGQVKGLSGPAVQKILEVHGIDRVLSSEGGRTSRGTVNFAREYAAFLNGLDKGPLGHAGEAVKREAFGSVEARLVELVKAHFALQKLAIQINPELSPTAIVAAILDAAKERQAEIPGSTALGAVAQHLVGAKLALRFPDVDVGNHPYTAADEQTARAGDFQVGDGVFHVTVAPGEAVVSKCAQNIGAGLRPVLIVPANKLAMAAGHAEELGVEGRLDIYDLERFVSANLSEMAGYSFAGVREGFARLIEVYNERLQAVETDHSLMIKLG
jgi:hypothetical protein